jgi:type I restriction enzyme S subunit
VSAKLVRVGDALRLERRQLEVDPTSEYREIGIRSFGKGIFHKEPVIGDQLGNKRVFRIAPDDLVLSNVFAWEGAVALAGEAEQGMIGSHRFMTYVPRDERIFPAWAAWFFVSERGLELLGAASPGSAGRNRTLAIERFENLKIPLPPLDDQHRTAARLNRVREARTALEARAAQSSALIEAAQYSLVDSCLASGIASGWPLRLLSEVAMVNPRPSRLQPDDSVAFVPMAAVDAVTGSVMHPETKLASDIGSGYKQFAIGDVIFARITPCMQNGKCAVFEGPELYGYGSTEFHVVRAGPEVKARWLHRIMRSMGFRRRATARFKGTAGQQRVPADFLKTVQIPVPPISDQDAAAAELERIEQFGRDFEAKRGSAEKLISALDASAMNHEFADLT